MGPLILLFIGDSAIIVCILILKLHPVLALLFAAIIGTSLLRSGAAGRVIRGALKLFGEKRAPAAFLSSGFWVVGRMSGMTEGETLKT